MRVKLLILLSIILLIIPLYGQNGEYKTVSENSRYIMLFNEKTAEVAIKDKVTGKIFNQFPKDWEGDFSMGVTKFSIPSHLVLEMADEEAKISIYNTYALGVMRGNFKYKNIKDGIRIDYEFSTQGVTIAIEFILTEAGFKVRIPIDSIKEEGDLKINRIWVLPYFTYGSKKDNGYLIVPDGSGALVRFDHKVGNERGFELPVYGYDFGLPLYDMPPKTEGIRLPIFGAKRNDLGILGVIESGDFDSNIACYMAGNATSYFRVFPIFDYRRIHKFLLYEREASTGQAGEVVDVLVNKFSPYTIKKDIVVNYFLFTGKDIDYSFMIRTYRNYLLKNGYLNKRINNVSEVPFNLVIINSINIKTTKAGVPVIDLFPLTTFDETIKILEEFRNRGIKNINLVLKGYQSGGYMNKITNGIRLESKLGGNNGFKKLIVYCKNNNISLILTAEVIEVHSPGNGFSPSRDANRYLNNGLAFMYKWDPVVKKKNRDYDPWFTVLPERVPIYLNNFLKDLEKYNLSNILVEKMGDYISSQNKRPKFLSREEVASLWKENLSTYMNKFNFVFTSGNFYVLPYGSLILDIPLDSSNFAIESESVPLLQLLIHGYVPYSGKPGNLRESQKKEFLRMIEYGALPYYALIFKDSSYFKKSIFNEMVSSNYKDWIDQAVKEYNSLKDLYRNIYDVPMRTHEKLYEGVYRVEYENGTEVIVNYTNKPFSYKGKIVRGEDFVFFLGKN
ncbi:MAG: DUF5696 domain-containing protein [Dictyoglomus turgidum]|uniref:DUF5696 domain-containing protein n=1 Tax=Dictyoglomus turgidum TaxID=513050 RepID=UPI003C70794E